MSERVLGASNEVFYYGGKGNYTFNIMYPVTFKDPYDIDVMKTAADKAAGLYPELAIRPVVRDGLFEAESNDNSVVFIPDDGKTHHLGTDETGGYMFYFSYTDKSLVFHTYHGLCDSSGALRFLRTIFYFYLKEKGIYESDPDLEAGIRTEAAVIEDHEDAFDPYRKYADPKSERVPVDVDGEVFQIPEGYFSEDINHNREFFVTVSTSEFIKKTKELGVSFSPLIMALFADAIDDAYDMGDKTFTSMLPVDLRRFFGTETVVNFSDGILVVQSSADRKMNISDRCRKIKEGITAQLTKENFEAIMAAKVTGVDKAIELEKSKTVQSKGEFTLPFTIGISYPGKIYLGAQIESMIDSAMVRSYSRTYVIVGSTFGDDMTFSITQRNDSPAIAESLKRVLENYGFETCLKDMGYINKDVLIKEELKTV